MNKKNEGPPKGPSCGLLRVGAVACFLHLLTDLADSVIDADEDH